MLGIISEKLLTKSLSFYIYYLASQWQDNVQLMVSNALAKPQNLINVHTRRVGGGYGGKTRITGRSNNLVKVFVKVF